MTRLNRLLFRQGTHPKRGIPRGPRGETPPPLISLHQILTSGDLYRVDGYAFRVCVPGRLLAIWWPYNSKFQLNTGEGWNNLPAQRGTALEFALSLRNVL